MTDADDVAFAAIFMRLRGIFALRGDRGEIQQVVQVYFNVLRRFPLPVVDAAADRWLEKGQRFPKPADWLGMIDKTAVVSLPVMSEVEAREHRAAMALHYEDEPCRCHLCRAAGVSHRFLRYVPDTDDDDRDVRMHLDGQTVARGHWAHGDELRRWYLARDAFMALKRTVLPKVIADAEVQVDPRTGEPFDPQLDAVP